MIINQKNKYWSYNLNILTFSFNPYTKPSSEVEVWNKHVSHMSLPMWLNIPATLLTLVWLI